MAYANQLIICNHCNHPITGETKVKLTKNGEKSYIYYRCARYQTPGHPRYRLKERDIERQVKRIIDTYKLDTDSVKNLVATVAKHKLENDLCENQVKEAEYRRQLTANEKKIEKLLELRIDGEITPEKYESKKQEITESIEKLRHELNGIMPRP